MAAPGDPTDLTLNQREFEQLLQRAAERHVRQGPHDFTLAELIAAGRDLGIDEATVRRVHAEHTRDLRRPARDRPFDSSLRLAHDGDTLRLTIPPDNASQGGAVIRTLAMTALGVLVSVEDVPWLLRAPVLGLCGLFTYFSWRSARTSRELRLRRDGSGFLVRSVGKKSWGIPLQAGQVRVRIGERTERGQTGGRQVQFLALDHGTETYELLAGYSHAERAWAVEEIQRWLGH